MKQFLAQCIGGVLLMVIVSWGIADLSPHGWANQVLDEKWRVWSEQKPGTFNAVVIGSSHVYRQLNPAVIDSIARTKGRELRTFNLGSPAAGNLENFPTAEAIIAAARPSDGLQLMIVELLGLPSVSDHELIARRNYNWSFSELQFFARTTLQERTRWSQKLDNLWSGWALFCARALHLNHHELLNRVHPLLAPRPSHGPEPAPWLDADRRGWYSFEAQLRTEESPHLKQRRDRFSANGSKRLREKIDNRKQRLKRPHQAHNPVVLDRMLAMIQTASSKGIHCVFVTLPPSFAEAPQSALSDEKWGRHFFHCADFQRYPEFYTTDMMFDEGHLNGWGAQRMSELVAEEVLNQMP